jgi:hypothetical protein
MPASMQPGAEASMSGVPEADIVAQILQSPPGEDSETGDSYSLAEMLPILASSYKDLLEAKEAYDRADQYFRGISPEVFSDPQLRRLLGLSEDVYALNYAAIPVTAVANRMNISSISVPGNSTATAAAEKLWKTNKLHVEEHGFTVDSLRYGDNYMIIWPRDDGTVQMQPNNPLTTRVFYDPEDGRTKLYALKAWATDAKTIRADIYFPGYVYKFISNNSGRRWQEVTEPNGTWPMDNPYGEIPVFHWRAGDSVPYGTPEHANAYGPQDGLIKAANTLFATLDFLGFPQRYALIEAASASGTAEFSDFDLQQPDAFITDDAGRTSGLRQGPGELWTLRASQVGQFTPAPVDGFVQTWNQCISAMSAATGTPMRFFQDPGGQHPSGDSLRASDYPLKQKIRTRSLSFAASWEEAFTFALKLSKIPVDEVMIQWEPSSPSDDQDTAGMPIAVWKIRLGVPRKEVFRAMGYSETQMDSWGLGPEDDLATPVELWPKSADTPAAQQATAEEEQHTGTTVNAPAPSQLPPQPAAPGAPAPPAAGPGAPAPTAATPAPAAPATKTVHVPAHTRSMPN